VGHFPVSGGGGGSGTIEEITSTGDTVTITDPTGPITDLEVSASAGVSSFNTRTGAVTLSDADVAAILEAFTSTAGVSLADTSSSGTRIAETGTGGLVISDDDAGIEIRESGSGGLQLFAGGGGINVISPSNGFWAFTADILADLPTPSVTEVPAFGLTQDGHIYYYPSGGPWALIAPSAPSAFTAYPTSTITADPAPGVVGHFYRANYSGTFTLPTSPANGSFIIVKLVASASVLTFSGTVDGDAGYALTETNQSATLVYDTTSGAWNAI
jgi:hypothetical protein